MDLSIIALEKCFGFSPRKAVRYFLARMWIGYAFDAGEFAFTWIYVGMNWISDNWKWGFYGYVGGVGFLALLITLLMVCCILRGKEADGRIKRYKKIPYVMGYFKLTSAVNAGIIFFTLYYSDDKNEPEVLAIIILSGIDMGVNLIEMAFGLAGLSSQRLCNKDRVHTTTEESISSSPPAVSSLKTTSRKTRKK